ncbi:ATP synthase gamma chain [Stieleria neptunia]|uniref:ATP synthase gamma chain n=1 Tax=Stieleria neptunia TaxID=2527979 RepID=A0A518HNP0_9BACT|nr:F0F1 ATP synthase subunit gamma [Stieleria neptunia]QDV42465.1 ATP synthase gamma chain [Stieleria neptunia]
MNTLEHLRAKIETATDMQSVVKTMKTLAAVSIRQYERAADALAQYNQTVEMGFQIVLRDTGHGDLLFAADAHRATRTGAIVFGTDQGMCGQFNERIATTVLAAHERSVADENRSRSHSGQGSGAWKVLAVGTRVEGHLKEIGLAPERTLSIPASVSEITPLVQDLLLAVQHWREQSEISRLLVFYNRRSVGAASLPNQLVLLPIGAERYRRWSQQRWQSSSLPTFTIDRRRLLSCIVRQYLFVSLYRSCAESLSSENASRIAAMQVAERSIQDRLDDLTRAFNQIRQTAITEELLDVVSGFEALSGGENF